MDGRDLVSMALRLWALEQNARANFKVPQPNGTISVTSRCQAALGQECHATKRSILRRLHLRDDLLLLEVPQDNRVVEACSDDLGCVSDFLKRIIHHPAWLQHDNVNDGIAMAFHIVLLVTLFDLVRPHPVVCLKKQDSSFLNDADATYRVSCQLL